MAIQISITHRIKSFILSILMMISLIVLPNGASAVAIEYSISGALTWGDFEYEVNDDGNTVTVTKYKGSDAEVAVPSELDGKKVTNIGNYAFQDCRRLKSITIPNNVTSIGKGTFSYSEKLTSITIPNSVTSIGEWAFAGCTRLTSITIPNSVTSISEWTFSYTGLTSITIPNSVTSIGNDAFYDCTELTSITIPNSVMNIGQYTFYGCTGLTNIEIEFTNNYYIVEDGVLFNKDKTDIICYPAGKNELAYNIPNSVTSINNSAFAKCTGLTSITIPNSVTSIGDHAFSDCTGLTSVTIPNSVTSIGKDAFSDCMGLTSITIPNSVTSVGRWAFSGCTSLTICGYKGSYAETYSKENNIPFKSLVELPDTDSDTPLVKDILSCTLILTQTVYTYDGTEKRPDVTVTNGGRKLTQYSDYNVSYSNNVNVGTATVTVTGIGDYTGSKTATFTINPKPKTDISNCTLTLSQTEYVYDGEEKRPDVTVTNGGRKLTQYSDYNVSYSNNVNVGTATVTVTGIGDYTGSKTATFTINPKPKTDISNCTLTLSQTEYVYDGEEKKPDVIVANGSTKLTQYSDYNVSYSNNVNVGTATVTVIGIGDYTGTKTATFTINPKPKTDISNCTLTLSQTEYTYDGSEKRPTVTITNGSTKLTEDTDFTVSYSNNVNVGTATVTVTGIGDYAGTKTLKFTINAKSISDTIITLSQTSYTYDGTEKKPEVIVKDDTKTLSSEADYYVLYSNNINIGTAKATVSGKGNYTGSKSVNFEIKQKSEKFTNGADNWNFYNSRTNFGNSYYMNDKYWNSLLNGLSNTEKSKMNKYVKNAFWGGSCYGMATTSILASNGILSPSQYQDGANFLHDISAPPTNEVKSLINYYFSLQYTDVIQQQVCKNFYNSDEKAKLNSLLSCLEDGSATLLCFHGYFYGDSDNWGGHAVVAYGVEYGTYSFNGKAFNGKILIYDNNNINYSDEYCLYFNSSTGAWIIPHYELDSNKGSLLGLITDDLAYVNYHGYLSGNSNVITDDYIAILHSAAISGNYNLTKAAFANGTFTTTTTSDDDIRVFSSLSDNNFENSDIIFAMKDASSGYILKTSNPESLDLSMSYKESLLFAEASNASTARFAPNAYVEIDGNKTDYNLGIVLNDDYKVTDWYGLSVKGKDADKVVLETTNDGYILTSKDMNNISVTSYNDFVTVSTTFSTNYDKVYLYEIDEKTIGVAVDTDKNGTYETTLNTVTQKPGTVDTDNETDTDKPSDSDKTSDTDSQALPDDTPKGTCGDIDGDGQITSSDALTILRASAGLADLTPEQEKIADVDGDGSVTSSDALSVLRFSAGLSSNDRIGKPISA